MSKKLTGIVLSYLLIGIDIVIGIMLVPFLLHSLGDYGYGVYKLLFSTASYLAVLDFGIGGTITRYIVKYRTEKKEEEKESFMAMGLIIYGVLALVVIAFASFVCAAIPSMYKASIKADDMQFAQIMFMVLCTTTAVRLFNHAYHGLFAAYERFTYSKGVNITQVLLRVLLLVVGLYFIKSAMVVAAVDLSLAVSILILNIFYTKFGIKFKVKLHKWDNTIAKEAGVFTLAILFQSIINQFNTNANNMILGVFVDAASIALYSIALQLYSMYGNLSTSVSSIFLPSISRNVFAGASDDEITESIIRPSRMQLMVLLLALSGFVLFGKDFIGVWVGEGYDMVYVLACILLATSTIDLSQNTITSVLKAKNKLHGKTAILGASTAVNILITFLLVPRFGIVGAVIGTAFSMIFGYGLALNLYYHFKIGVNMITYYKKTYKGILPAVLIALIPGAVINHFIAANSWILFIVEAAAYCVFYGFIIYFIGMNKSEKEYVGNLFKKLMVKK